MPDQRDARPTLDSGGGGLESVESVELERLLVDATPEGAGELGQWYWDELEDAARGLIRARREGGGVRLVLGGMLTLLRFGEPEVRTGDESTECRYPLLGGSLALRPGGSLTISQVSSPVPRLEVRVTEYHPRLAGWGRTIHRGLLYTALQAPLHRVVSRRFLTRAPRRRS